MEIIYKTDRVPAADVVATLYEKAGLPRPTHDVERIGKMLEHSNLVVTAWDGEKLVGIARSITDHYWSCYLADLAIDPGYQRSGIGKKLIWLTKEKLGEQSMVLLLSVPDAMDYYPKAGMQALNNAFIINREK